MELKRALELRVEYSGTPGTVHVDRQEYICLNDLQAYFPNKRIDKWIGTNSTKELISAVETRYQLPLRGGVIGKRGKYGGTYAHHLIALDFAAWLSVEFKLAVYESYINGTQHKKDWNIKRILSAFNYKLMADAIQNAHEHPQGYHYSNEALLLNEVVFGVRDGGIRDTATEEQLDMIAALEADNTTMIKLGMAYEERKKHLIEFFHTHTQKKIASIEARSLYE